LARQRPVFLREEAKKSQKKASQKLDELSPVCESCTAALVRRFRQLVHQGREQDLDDGTTRGETSPVRELVRFARRLRAEWPHVMAGLTYPASNGQTDGCINRLKAIKRQIYGRAGWPSLQQRVLHAA